MKCSPCQCVWIEKYCFLKKKKRKFEMQQQQQYWKSEIYSNAKAIPCAIPKFMSISHSLFVFLLWSILNSINRIHHLFSFEISIVASYFIRSTWCYCSFGMCIWFLVLKATFSPSFTVFSFFLSQKNDILFIFRFLLL